MDLVGPATLNPEVLEQRPTAEAAAEPSSPWRRDLLVLGAFALLGAVKLAHHEMWRDELQAWMLARDSQGLDDLLHNIRYEGTPGLWHLLLFGLSRFTRAPQAMQALHLVLATAAATVVVRWSPFPYRQRVLFAFGYFPFFEYLNVSRGYVLGLLFSMMFCALAWRPNRCWLRLGTVLALLALTSAYGLLLAVALGSTVLFDQWRMRSEAGVFAGRPGRAMAGAAVFAAGLLLALLRMRPPPDAAAISSWGPVAAGDRLLTVLGDTWSALAPIPPRDRRSWGLNILASEPRYATMVAVLGLALIVLVALRIHRDPPGLWLWLFGTGLLLGFAVVGFHGSLRHWGTLLVLLVAVAWLMESRASLEEPPRVGRAGLRPVLTVLLVMQLVASVVGSARDLALPFSNSSAAADFIRAGPYEDAILIGHPDFAASSVGALLDRPIYYPQAQRTGSYVLWDMARTCPTAAECVTDSALWELALAALDENRAGLLVVNRPLEDHLPVRTFVGSVRPDEDYYLYELRGR